MKVLNIDLFRQFSNHFYLQTNVSIPLKISVSLCLMASVALSLVGRLSRGICSALDLVICHSVKKNFNPSKIYPLPDESKLYNLIPNMKRLKPPLINSPEVEKVFHGIHSNQLIPLNRIKNREDFKEAVKKKTWQLQPVILSKSSFVSEAFTEHLMRLKKDSALGVKYVEGDGITNMEGALHTFITPVVPITMTGDYVYQKKHTLLPLNGYGRQVVLSAAIHPDFENGGEDEVIMKVVEVKDQPLTGKPLSFVYKPLWVECQGDLDRFKQGLQKHEELLQKHMVYHLMAGHRLPACSEVQHLILSSEEAVTRLEEWIIKGDEDLDWQGFFVNVNGHVIAMEALFSLYLHQMRNEFSVLEQMLPQGYVYTIDPPSIFAKQLGGTQNVNLLNRLQILALKQLNRNSPFKNLKVIGFNDYADKQAIPLLAQIFKDKQVISKQTLFKNGPYSIKDPYALVLHNNSDAFGQNIETEGPFSMDGLIGSYSDASCHLQRGRSSLLKYIF